MTLRSLPDTGLWSAAPQPGFDPTNPPYPGWTGWLAGIAALRRYHELPQWRSHRVDARVRD